MSWHSALSIEPKTGELLNQIHSPHANKTFIYDIECYPNYFVAVFQDIATNEFHTYTLSSNIINEIIYDNTITLIGFNNSYYDNLLLNYISQRNGLATHKDLYELSKEIIESDEPSLRVNN